MSRGYINSHELKDSLKMLREYMPEEVLADPAIKDLFEPVVDPVAVIACRIIRWISHDMEKLGKLLTAYARAPANNGSAVFSVPVIMDPADKGGVIVFPNLRIATNKLNDVATLKQLAADFGSREYLAPIKEDVEKMPQRFADTRRIIRAVGRREKMPLTRALARYANPLYKDRLTPAVIQAIGEEYAEIIKGFTLNWCKTAEDYIAMYENGPSSCMVAAGGNRDWAHMIKHMKINPTSFFFFHPCSTGVYVQRDGKVIARCIVYEGETTDKKKIKGHGRVYSTNADVGLRFHMALEAAGFPSLPGGERAGIELPVSFEIPGFHDTRNNHWIMPLPYFDNLRGNLRADWDAKNKKFLVSFAEGKSANLQLGSTQGYHVGGIEQKTCARCAKPFAAGGLTAQDGTTFCGAHCANMQGYLNAIRGDGEAVLVRRTEHMITCDGDMHPFTNEAAAIQQGRVRMISTMDREDKDYGHRTRHVYKDHHISACPVFGIAVRPIEVEKTDRWFADKSKADLKSYSRLEIGDQSRLIKLKESPSKKIAPVPKLVWSRQYAMATAPVTVESHKVSMVHLKKLELNFPDTGAF